MNCNGTGYEDIVVLRMVIDRSSGWIQVCTFEVVQAFNFRGGLCFSPQHLRCHSTSRAHRSQSILRRTSFHPNPRIRYYNGDNQIPNYISVPTSPTRAPRPSSLIPGGKPHIAPETLITNFPTDTTPTTTEFGTCKWTESVTTSRRVCEIRTGTTDVLDTGRAVQSRHGHERGGAGSVDGQESGHGSTTRVYIQEMRDHEESSAQWFRMESGEGWSESGLPGEYCGRRKPRFGRCGTCFLFQTQIKPKELARGGRLALPTSREGHHMAFDERVLNLYNAV